jgi:hypothetical protein
MSTENLTPRTEDAPDEQGGPNSELSGAVNPALVTEQLGAAALAATPEPSGFTPSQLPAPEATKVRWYNRWSARIGAGIGGVVLTVGGFFVGATSAHSGNEQPPAATAEQHPGIGAANSASETSIAPKVPRDLKHGYLPLDTGDIKPSDSGGFNANKLSPYVQGREVHWGDFIIFVPAIIAPGTLVDNGNGEQYQVTVDDTTNQFMANIAALASLPVGSREFDSVLSGLTDDLQSPVSNFLREKIKALQDRNGPKVKYTIYNVWEEPTQARPYVGLNVDDQSQQTIDTTRKGHWYLRALPYNSPAKGLDDPTLFVPLLSAPISAAFSWTPAPSDGSRITYADVAGLSIHVSGTPEGWDSGTPTAAPISGNVGGLPPYNTLRQREQLVGN